MKYCRTKLAEPTRGRNTYHRETNITDDVESSHYRGYVFGKHRFLQFCVWGSTRYWETRATGKHALLGNTRYWETHITVTLEAPQTVCPRLLSLIPITHAHTYTHTRKKKIQVNTDHKNNLLYIN